MEVSKSEFLKSRLFLPLTTEAFEWYQMGKTIEVRIKKGRFKNIHKFNYKFAELRKGYNGRSLYAIINVIDEYSSTVDLLRSKDHQLIVPLNLNNVQMSQKLERYVDSDYPLLAIHLSFISIV